MATREGVEKQDKQTFSLPATAAQRRLVASLKKDFPDAKESFEYEDFMRQPTRGNAHEFIARTLEQHTDAFDKRENYVSYMALRPRAERQGPHGLFTAGDAEIHLAQVAQEVSAHQGNVWTGVLSLRREDAQRLGYDNAAAWKLLLSQHMPAIAEQFGVSIHNMRWWAAFHDEGHHPHVHLMCFAANGQKPHLSQNGIVAIRSLLARQIFSDELTPIYAQQSQSRDALRDVFEQQFRKAVYELQTNLQHHDGIEQLLETLHNQIADRAGKMQYGYLPWETKQTVDAIVTQLETVPQVQKAYNAWWNLRRAVLSTYRDDTPETPAPLATQEELRHLKNIVLRVALEPPTIWTEPDPVEPDIEPDPVEPGPAEPDPTEPAPVEPDIEPEPVQTAETDTEQKMQQQELNDEVSFDFTLVKMRRLLDQVKNGTNTVPKELIQHALQKILSAADGGSCYAAYHAGKIYRDGYFVARSERQAEVYFLKAAEKKNTYAQYALGKLYAKSESPLYDPKQAVHWFEQAVEQRNQFAEYQLAKFLLKGEGCDKNAPRAAQLLADIIDSNDSTGQHIIVPWAMYQLGKMYLYGNGVKKDFSEAEKLLQAAAERGNVYAQDLLDRRSAWEHSRNLHSLMNLAKQFGRLLESKTPQTIRTRCAQIDRKHQQELRNKRRALGHAENDFDARLEF